MGGGLVCVVVGCGHGPVVAHGQHALGRCGCQRVGGDRGFVGRECLAAKPPHAVVVCLRAICGHVHRRIRLWME